MNYENCSKKKTNKQTSTTSTLSAQAISLLSFEEPLVINWTLI